MPTKKIVIEQKEVALYQTHEKSKPRESLFLAVSSMCRMAWSGRADPFPGGVVITYTPNQTWRCGKTSGSCGRRQNGLRPLFPGSSPGRYQGTSHGSAKDSSRHSRQDYMIHGSHGYAHDIALSPDQPSKRCSVEHDPELQRYK